MTRITWQIGTIRRCACTTLDDSNLAASRAFGQKAGHVVVQTGRHPGAQLISTEGKPRTDRLSSVSIMVRLILAVSTLIVSAARLSMWMALENPLMMTLASTTQVFTR